MNDGKKSVENDEFDVEELAGKLFRVARKAFFWLLAPVIMLFSDWKKWTSALALGIVSALALYFTLTPIYKSAFTLKPSNRSDLFFFSVSHNIEQAVKSHETEAIKKMLGCSDKIADNIAEIKINPRWVRPAKKDSLNAIIVELSLRDPIYFDSVQHLFLRYIESSPYYDRTRKTRETAVRMTLNKLRNEMQEIDSLKKVALGNMQPRGGNGFVFGEPLNPVKLYEEALNLYKQEIGYATQLQYLDNFEVISDCLPVSRPQWPNLLKLLFISCCFYSALIIAIFWIRNRRA